MPDQPLHGILHYLQQVATRGDHAHVPDGQLLVRFVTERDEAAFELLVWRHSKMVYGVCRRLLRDTSLAEDAFQAAFLTLARRASSIGNHDCLGGWLYKVAYRVALEARARSSKRAARELPLPEGAAATAGPDPGQVVEQQELRQVIDEEIQRLPEKYRLPFILCYLEGNSNGEAARTLGCPVGTVESRLTRARARLRTRLARRECLPAVGLVAAIRSVSVASAAATTDLVRSAVQVATQVAMGSAAAAIPAPVAALSEAVVKAMGMTKQRIFAVVLVLGCLSSGAGLFTHWAWGEKAPEKAEQPSPPAAPPAQEGKAPPTAPARFAAAPGYAWAIEPKAGRGVSWAIGWNPPPQKGLPARAGIAAIEETDPEGGLVITLAHPPSRHSALPDYRPVAFDAEGKRYALKIRGGAGTATAALVRYRLDPMLLPASKVTHLGIEVVTPEGITTIAAAATERARQAGVDVLPLVKPGAGYDFVLTTMDGKKIRSQDLRGKVVLIDCWATWCSPCMALLPEIKAMYEKHRGEGLEVIGINYDHDAEKARKACEKHGLTWPQVIVPKDEETRQLWQESSGIGSLPRVLLLDREGILRVDGTAQLQKDVLKLLEKAPEAVKEKGNR